MSGNLDTASLVILALSVAVAAGLFLYSSYWAFSVRKALAGPLYRRQALWVAIAGGLFTVFFCYTAVSIASQLSGNYDSAIFLIVDDLFILAVFIILFAWIDATIRVARRADPLHRNTLRWTVLRYFVLIGAAFAIFFSVVPAYWENNPASFVDQGSALLAPTGGALFLGGLTLLVSAGRSKDAILRRHLKWLGVFVIFLYLTNRAEQELVSHQVAFSNSILLQIATYCLYAVSAFFLYESARSLTMFNRFPPLGAKAQSDQAPSSANT